MRDESLHGEIRNRDGRRADLPQHCSVRLPLDLARKDRGLTND
jgi:hypothetical protein